MQNNVFRFMELEMILQFILPHNRAITFCKGQA